MTGAPVQQLTLAGIAAECSAAPVSDADRRKEYTAEGLKLARPRDYELAARAYFMLRLSKRGICDLLGLSPHTLEALILRESSTRGTAELEARRRARLFLTEERALDVLNTLLDDPKARRKAGIVGVSKAVAVLAAARGDPSALVAAPNAAAPTPVIAPDDYIEVTDQPPPPNESRPEKKGARPDSPVSTPGAQADDKPAAGPVSTPRRSVEVSDISATVADGGSAFTTSRAAGPQAAATAARNAAATAAAEAAAAALDRGGGGPGVRARAPIDNKCIRKEDRT